MDEIVIELMSSSRIPEYNHLVSMLCSEQRYLARIEPPTLDESGEIFHNCQDNNLPFLIATQNDRMLGWCHLQSRNRPVYEHCAVLGMGVEPMSRGQGVGHSLLMSTITAAQDIGLERIELEVFSANTRAISLYSDMGFVIEGKRLKGWKFQGRYDDVVEMALFLAGYSS